MEQNIKLTPSASRQASEQQVIKAIIRDHPLLLYIETAVDSSMKHLLLINDHYGTKVIREALLDEMNKLRKMLIVETQKEITEWALTRTFSTSSVSQPPLPPAK